MPISTHADPLDAPRSHGVPASELCFLVAEDHEFQRSMLVQMLENLGATGVYEAEDGRAAMEITRELEHPFDIIVTDIDMPGMDGLSFIRRLGEAGVGASLIVTSSLDRPLLDTIETMSAAYGMRLLGAVEKPLSQEQLAELIALHWRAKPNPERPRPGAAAFTLDEILAGLRADEFEPFYQPKVELRTGRVKGAEALARWRHPRHGIILPYAFLGLLEDNAQISELTWSILAQGARDCRSWRDAGLDLDVSVNLSGRQLADPGISDAITWQVINQGLEPKHMILEITESAAITDVGRVLENLTRLRMKGFGLSIDDYGTGYSSMQQLTRIPFTELKIDQSFVMHAARQESSRLILESSLDMARKLGIVSVAEGVETPDDWNLLRQSDCDLAQGFHIAKPMPSGDLAEWMRGWG
ncbi:EAL domain-containing protein [Thermomonas sp.]|jgi:EAL domain-containing protein (putative c-di-GMP-specific phosphodiesterase class I)|uniref:EAL domain-containing response regulator n=1 Tax=Thermomonas sp. TaxID=1971895 RepID=UPI0035B4D413